MDLSQPPRRSLREVHRFGGIDADADDLLDRCFRNHPAFASARSMQKFLILGRKGDGKTAIFKKLLNSGDPDTYAIGHTFDDYPWAHHDLQAQVGVPEERRYVHSWKFLMLIGLAKRLLKEDHREPLSDEGFEALAALERFVVDSYGSKDPEFGRLFSPEKTLDLSGGISLPPFEVNLQRLRVRDLPIHIAEVNRSIQDAVLRVLDSSSKYFVCFDQLDLGFSTQDTNYAQRLTGLIIAARDLFVSARNAGKPLNIAVFLRDDIYQDLQFEDKNKITENFASFVRWSEDGLSLTLRDLMETRFTELLSRDGSTPVSWEQVFSESREMPGRQPKYKHICDRTFLRPRDMIKFCNEVLDAYQAAPAGELLDNEAVHAARDSYSDYLLRELDDEIGKHVPEYKQYLEVIKLVGAERFHVDEFETAWTTRGMTGAAPPRDALAALFEFSVLAYRKSGGRGGGSEWVWRYKDTRAQFDTTSENFRVHPGFKESLGLIR